MEYAYGTTNTLKESLSTERMKIPAQRLKKSMSQFFKNINLCRKGRKLLLSFLLSYMLMSELSFG